MGGYTSLNTESIALESYPTCSWNNDAWSQFVAQQGVPLALSTLSNVGGTMANIAMANMFSNQNMTSNQIDRKNELAFGSGVLSGICNNLSRIYTASITTDTCRGTFNNGGVNIANNKQQFYKSRVHVTKDYCESIDNFFSVFGYATNKVKLPNIGSRPHWNYIKTTNCAIVGEAPSEDIKQMCNIFNNGITFWKNGDEVGNYNLDNSPE